MGSDLFPGFSTRNLRGAGAEVFARVGGTGQPLLLVHGYPQTHMCWHEIANRLAEDYTVVACDLRGYGGSGTPEALPQSAAFSKRAMAMDLVAAMEELGFFRFFIAGHDRGARAAYRLALDHPGRVAGLAVMNILPTFAMWAQLETNEYAMKAFRWFLLAQPSPFPENLLKTAGPNYLHATLRDWTKKKDLSAFDPRALAAYEAAHTSDTTIMASCADYRAGWTSDRFHDQSDLDAGRKIACPTLALWGDAEFPDEALVLETWREIASDVTGRVLDCGHFAPEEAPEEVHAALWSFLQRIGPIQTDSRRL
jgi:haloacetate dehalogenase